ncbi:putative divalent cation/proton antiporter TMEM165 [Zophobas morio]|uniref:putative divalent cation/proton antiporter TMEM165 n=1 Tax=Zophobas morio TaxID=2755281 RepID=UPI0030827F32
MRSSRLLVLIGACGALFVMTMLSSYVGSLTAIIPKIYTFSCSTFLLFFFGIKMLYEGIKLPVDYALEEYERVQQEINSTEKIDENSSTFTNFDVEEGKNFLGIRKNKKILIQSFVMTFLAEWGDRSQIATFLLAARENSSAVILGGFLGHSICTFSAVIGGRLLARRISARSGGIVFLFFAGTSLLLEIKTF